MNKKFMVVALMAALSTVGYAAKWNDDVTAYDKNGNSTGFVGATKGQENFDYLKEETDRLNQANIDMGNLVTNIQLDKADKTEVDNLTGRVDEIKKDFDYAKAESELKDKEHDKAIEDLTNNKADKNYVDAENKKQDEVIANKADKNYVDAENKKQDEAIEKFQDQMNKYDGRLSGLEKKVDHLDDKMNKGLSLMAAMNAVDFQNVQTGEMAIGAGVGHYGNAQSVALGVAYSPVEDLTVNAKYSVTAGDADSFALGAGATYKFKVGR
mgnify:CR=1 FL=1